MEVKRKQIARKQLDIMPTYHYVQNKGKLMMESRENSQISQFGQFFNDFEVIYLQIAHFSEKQVSFKFKVIFSTNFRPKTKKIIKVVFEKNIKVSDFGLIQRPFPKYLQIKKFFKFVDSVTLIRYQPKNQPTNQMLSTIPILQDLADAGPIT